MLTTPCDFKLLHSSMEFHSLTQGHPRLCQALAELYGELYGRSIDPLKEVIICNGALEALFVSFTGTHRIVRSNTQFVSFTASIEYLHCKVNFRKKTNFSFLFEGLLNPGDEVVVIEPFLDKYIGQIALAGGTPKFVSLHLVRLKYFVLYFTAFNEF